MKKIIIPIVLLMVVMTLTSFVMAGDFKINYAGSPIFTVATNGTVTAEELVINGLAKVVGNISTDTFFVGDGRYITDISTENIASGTFNAARIPTLDYHNITAIPTCGANTYLEYDGTDLACTAVTNALISGENITTGTINFDRLPSLVNKITLAYQNITGIPSCTITEFLQFNATGMFCVAGADTDTWDTTNIAFYNKTQTWSQEQVFSEFVNVTKGIKLQSNTSYISRVGTNTSISIDSSGNLIINLG